MLKRERYNKWYNLGHHYLWNLCDLGTHINHLRCQMSEGKGLVGKLDPRNK